MRKKLRNMALPKKALLFLLCAMVPLSGVIGAVLLAKPTLAAGETPGTPAYYEARLEDAKVAVNWIADKTPFTDYQGNPASTAAEGPWKLDLNYTNCSAPWNGTAAVPTVGGGTTGNPYEVTTAEQFHYCVQNRSSFKLMNDIDLAGYWGTNWTTPGSSSVTWTADGNGFTVWNYRMYQNTTVAGHQSMFGIAYNVTIKNLRVSNALAYRNPTAQTTWAAIFIVQSSNVQILNCAAENTLVETRISTGSNGWGGSVFFSGAPSATNLIDNCYTKNCHVINFVSGSQIASCCAIVALNYGGTISNTFAIEGSVVGNKGHNGGFTSCSNAAVTINNCFSDIDMYGNMDAGTFIGVTHTSHTISNCFTSGKVEGTQNLGGFTGGLSPGNTSNVNMFTNCYSTTMVGVMPGASQDCQGGFIGSYKEFNGTIRTSTNYFNNCYAAGEVGTLNNIPQSGTTLGGFVGDNSFATKTYTNCFYDKQTTAMREWASGQHQCGQHADVAGITGVLTTDATKNSTPLTGLISAPGSNGFTGFSDNSQWVFEPDHYPQLLVFADTATIEANFTNTNWMTRGDLTDLIKAYSRASTSTVKLATWETGYDGQALPANTYDTVRDVMLDFGMTQGAGTAWNRVGNGPTLANGTGNTTEINGQNLPVLRLTPPGGVYGGQYRARELQPGVEWLRVNAKVGSQVGTRALRVVPTSGLAAGPDVSLVRGIVDIYDHRDGVRLSYSTGPDMAASPPKAIDEMVFKAATTDFINIDVPTQLQLELGDTLPPGKLHVRVSPLEGYHPNGDPILGDPILGGPLGLTDASLEMQLTGETPVLLTGRYVVEYFWVMNDGRYMRGYKLMDLSSAIKNARVSEDGGSTWLDWDNGLEDEPVTVRAGDWIEYEIAVDYAGRDLPARVIDERVFSPQTTE